MPMMQRMLDQIDRFVQLDIPFLLEERRDRIQKLKDVMGKADVAISEKYRRIVEAYQIELDFGRTLESYEGKLQGDPAGRTVRFLRMDAWRCSTRPWTVKRRATGTPIRRLGWSTTTTARP